MQKIPATLKKRIAVEWFITLVLGAIACYFLIVFKKLPKRGFFCDDQTLKYPYHGDTITMPMVAVMSLFIPLSVMIFGEVVMFYVTRKVTNSNEEHKYFKAYLKFHYYITPFLCGYALHACIVHWCKHTLGRLRPNFFEACQPHRLSDGSTCEDPDNYDLYIEDYECDYDKGAQIDVVNNAHLSFPSGHASYIFYGMIFIILYLQHFYKLIISHKPPYVGLFVLIIQMFCAVLACYVAFSRVIDYKHHWSDVLVGTLLGTSLAIAVTLHVRRQLKSVLSPPENNQTVNTATFTTNVPGVILVP